MSGCRETFLIIIWRFDCRVQSAGCRVQGAGCRVQGAGCRVQDSGRRGTFHAIRQRPPPFRQRGIVSVEVPPQLMVLGLGRWM